MQKVHLSYHCNIANLQVPDQASSILAKDARPHLLKLGDIAQAPHQHGQSQFETCSHCSGSVQNI